MPRRNKAGRFTRQTTTRRRRRTSKALNLTNTAESVLVANAFTTGVFGTDIVTFLTKGYGAKSNVQTPYTTSITLPDLFERLIPGGSSGMVNTRFANIPDSIKANLQRDGLTMAAQIILIPAAFKMAKKVLAKPVIRPANRMLKMSGLEGTVKL